MAESIDNALPLIDDEKDDNDEDEKELKQFSSRLDQFQSVIPETVTKYYMQQCALQTDDDRCVKLMALSVQKFMSEIIKDCYQLQKLREKSITRSATNPQPVVPEGDKAGVTVGIKKPASANITLTLNDLTHVLDDYDINVKKTFYYT